LATCLVIESGLLPAWLMGFRSCHRRRWAGSISQKTWGSHGGRFETQSPSKL